MLIESVYEEQFVRLKDYGVETLESNPNSYVKVDIVINEEV